MRSQRPDNPFDAIRRVIEHEANQDDDNGFFAKLGGIDPEPDDDGPTAKGLFQHMSRYETEDIPGDYGLPVRPDITRDNGDKLPTGPTEADYQQAWDAIRAAAKPAIEHTLKVWENMRHNRPLMNALGIYRLPGDKPLIHNGRKPR